MIDHTPNKGSDIKMKHFVDFSNTEGELNEYRVDAEKMIRGDSQQLTRNLFSDPSKQFHCGIWEGAPALWNVSYSEHEYCHILQGKVRITDAQGNTKTVSAGDHFVIEAGFSGTWETLEQTKKIYVVFEPRT
jgi:uncharacterized protein